MSASICKLDFDGARDEQQWFGIRVRTRKEAFSSAALGCRGFQCFSPTYTVRRRWSDRVKEIPEALFPGYVFCRLNIQHRVSVLSAPGVIEIVGLGRTPEPIPDDEIQAIQQAVELCNTTRPWPYVSVGQRVRIEAGPLTGTEGVLLKVKNSSRLILSIHLLQRSIAVELDERHVVPLNPPTPLSARSSHLSI
jgi:transcription antitermination factor NusG